MQKQQGFTLIEMMVAMIIGLLLMTGVIRLFSSMKDTSMLQDEVARMQESGRLAMELLGRDVRNADYWGCAASATVSSVIDPTGAGYNPLLHGAPSTSGGLAGTNDVVVATLGNLAGTDTISFRGADTSSDINVLTHNLPAAQIGVDNRIGISQFDVLLVTNCVNADIFQVTNPINNPENPGPIVHNTGVGAPGNTTIGNPLINGQCTNCLSTSYQNTGAKIMRTHGKIYSIKQGASGEPALFVDNSSNCPNGCELVSGIEDMQILYGEDLDGPDASGNLAISQYVAANAVSDMQNVLAVRVNLLVRTEEAIASTAQSVTFNGATVDTSDLRLRKVYTSTITLRNRM